MVILSDGEKWACEACLKGHRVSSCSHRERQLYHVNKKGRPVSQCQHCRGLRKSRATHVKCICAEPSAPSPGCGDRALGERKCQCGNGLPCTCALKRETGIDDLHKSAALNAAAAARTHRRAHSYGKPVMSKHRSDNIVPSRNVHGLHPPLHRHNNSAHASSYPYTIKQFTTSTPDINAMQNSPGTYLQPPLRPMGLPRSSQSTSNLPQFFGPFEEARSPALSDISSSTPTTTFDYPQSAIYGPHDGLSSPCGPSEQDFRPTYDPGFTSNSLSPGNPARYSVNDFSNLNWPAFGDGSQVYSQPAYSASASQLSRLGSLYNNASFAASTGQLQPELSVWNEDTSSVGYDDSTAQTPQRNSLVSLDHPGLTYSPSNTISDVESTAYHSDAGHMSRQVGLKHSWSAEDAINPQQVENAPTSQGHASIPLADLSLAYRPMPADETASDYFEVEQGGVQQDFKSDSLFLEHGSDMQYSADTGDSGLINLDESMNLSSFNPAMSLDDSLWEAYTNDGGYEQQNLGIPYRGETSGWQQ